MIHFKDRKYHIILSVQRRKSKKKKLMTTSAFDLWRSNRIQYLNAWNYKGEWDIRFVTNVVIAWNIRRTCDLKFSVADSDLTTNSLFVTRRYVWISSLVTIGYIRRIVWDDSEQHIKTSIGKISVNSYNFFFLSWCIGLPIHKRHSYNRRKQDVIQAGTATRANR